MACGVGLGLFVICLFQAERVGSSASQGQTSLRLNNQYVGYLQRDSHSKQLDSLYPQNRLRQALSSPRSAQSSSSSFDSQTKPNGYRQTLYTKVHTLSHPAASYYNSAKSRSSKPDGQTNQEVKAPKIRFQLSDVASGASVSQTGPKRQLVSDQGTRSSEQNAEHAGSKPYSLPRPKNTLSQASEQSSIKAPRRSAVNPPAQSGQNRLPSQFALEQAFQKSRTHMKMSVSSPGRRVSQKSKSDRQQSSPQKWSKWDFGNNLKTKYEQPSNTRFVKKQMHKAKLLSAENEATAGRLFAPSNVYSIPDRFGGYAIRRLKSPSNKVTNVQRPSRVAPQQQSPSRLAPQQQAASRGQRVQPSTKWKLVRLGPQ